MEVDTSDGTSRRLSSRQFAAVLVGGFGSLVLGGLLLSGALDPFLSWSDSWARVLQAFGSVVLSGALVYLYYQQRNISQSQADIMDNQEQLMVSQHVPTLFQLEWDLGHSCPYSYTTRLSNESDNLAHALYLRFDVYLDRREVQQASGVRPVRDPTRSGEDVYSIADLVFTEDATVATLASSRRSVPAPLTIADGPAPLGGAVSPQIGGTTPSVSMVSPGEDAVLTTEVAHTIESLADPSRTAMFDTLPFDELASYLRDLGFGTLYVWIGIEYLDPIDRPHSTTFHTRRLDISKPHYANNPFREWSYPAGKNLNELRTDTPRHPDC